MTARLSWPLAAVSLAAAAAAIFAGARARENALVERGEPKALAREALAQTRDFLESHRAILADIARREDLRGGSGELAGHLLATHPQFVGIGLVRRKEDENDGRVTRWGMPGTPPQVTLAAPLPQAREGSGAIAITGSVSLETLSGRLEELSRRAPGSQLLVIAPDGSLLAASVPQKEVSPAFGPALVAQAARQGDFGTAISRPSERRVAFARDPATGWIVAAAAAAP